MKEITPAQRLIVAADFKPVAGNNDKDWVRNNVLKLADCLSGTGVCLKINSALRVCGYELINEIHLRELAVFADLKLFDIGATLETDGSLLREFKPEILTVVCTAGAKAMSALKRELPNTEVLGVTVLTSLSQTNVRAIFNCSINDAVMRFAGIARSSGINGLISSPFEVEILKECYGSDLSLNTPAIRPEWSFVSSDDQNPNRVMTPAQAILVGADRIIVGRPIIQSADPYEAVVRTIEEITLAVQEKNKQK